MAYTVDFPAPGTAVTWTLTGDGVRRESREYAPTLFAGADADRLDELEGVFDGHPRVRSIERVQRRPGWRHDRETVLRIDARSPGAVDELAATASQLGRPGEVRLYNVDLDRGFRFCLETGTDPTPEREPSVLRVAVPPTSYERGLSKATVDGETVTGDPEGVAAAVRDRIAAADPDVLRLASGRIVPLLFEAADEPAERYALGRETGYTKLAGRSTVESYGTVGHSPARFALPGRAVIDEANTFWLAETSLEGILDLVARARMPLQETARSSIGAVLTAIMVRHAHERDVLVPWRSWRHERFKTARTLDAADRGGHTLSPSVGVHEDVHELDFASLYPTVICEHNLSPETVQCDCHPDREDVPGLGYAVCPDGGFLPDVLAPIIEDRARCKRRLATTDDPEAAATLQGKADALKWILVCCFGYQGFDNAKFGRIEVHEAITAHAREIILDAKATLEEHGWRVVHGIVDSLWVTPAEDRDQTPLDAVVDAVTAATGIRLEREGDFDWIAFCPRRNDDAGALTRYFGRRSAPDGPEYTVKGIEARQRSTPAYVEDAQRALIREFDDHRDPERVCGTLEGHVRALRRGAVDPADLAIEKRVSKPREAYRRATRNVAALNRTEDAGLEVFPGQSVEYVVVDDDRRDRERVRLLAEEPATYDADFYVEELVRACATVLSPVGWREAEVREYLADRTDASLSSYGH